ncbi:MAG: 3-deoxy-manno-octulosonate cytidylyltransferase [Thermoanaerobaculum sp.]|nr:3-deoxy-manno-octulosonate cytidylyltransferase [Thermoanaerobaculum sp.]MDW7967875.1 3-deoxy-manno-octulosonate cytidylyltransferase [Thermoanaerobaculum sp.]
MTARRALAVIPARMGATRFPGKPLVQLLGKPMVAHVVERALEAGVFAQVIVATDHPDVAEAAQAAGAHAVLTGPARSGTDRVAMAVAEIPGEVVLNVQGDEPAVPPENLRMLAQLLLHHPEVPMATLALPGRLEDLENPNVVKVVCDDAGRALYFSRAGIPFQRQQNASVIQRHVGLYGFQRDVLARLASLPEHPLEVCEGLEQLRALAAGIPIYVLRAASHSVAVDTPADVPLAEAALARLQGGGG